MNIGDPDVLCDCGGTFYTPTKVREEIERAQREAYAEGRKDERNELVEVGWVLVEWANNEHGKTVRVYNSTELLELPFGRHPVYVRKQP